MGTRIILQIIPKGKLVTSLHIVVGVGSIGPFLLNILKV